MKKEEIIQVIRDYVNDDKAKYAVLINGAWGSGKTYFYDKVLKQEILFLENGSDEKKGNVYISLYGVSSVEQLSKELVTNYFLKVKLHGDKSKEKMYEKVSKATGIFSKMFTFSVGGLSIDFEKGIEGINKSIDIKDMVICFDDLERCSIPINELFGMINTLVEHCNCKVIILADEENIGKMYANTNVEAKYLTLLLGRKLSVKKDNEKNKGGDKTSDKLTVEELKKLNEKIYSENYVYKDIKEKVIGLSLKYTPDLETEYDSIIEDTISDERFSNMLKESKENILEYMEQCDNNNIRIMRVWLLNFERIFKVIYKHFSQEKYFDEVFERFSIYTIRVACAIGKNKKLAEWKQGVEIGYIDLDDGFLLEREGYRFVDDLYRDSIFDEIRICRVARYILKEKENEEIAEKESKKGKTYKKLNQWYFLEDDDITESLPILIEEINNDEYIPQMYQKIISLLIILEREKYCDKDYMSKVCDSMIYKIGNIQERIEVENIQEHFIEEKGQLDLFHKYYDAIYSKIVEKNRDIDKKQLNEDLDYSTGESFLNYCRDNYNSFIEKGSFISYVNLEALKDIILNGKIEDIYNISAGFHKIYHFGNLYEFYSGDVDQLKEFREDLENMKIEGNTRKKAVQRLIATLGDKIEVIENKEE